MYYASVYFVTPGGLAFGSAFNRSPKKASAEAYGRAEDDLLSGRFGGCPSVGAEGLTMVSPYGRVVYSEPIR